MTKFCDWIRSKLSTKSVNSTDNIPKNNFFGGIGGIFLPKLINIQTIITGGCLGLGTIFYSEYAKPNSFIRYNTDKLVTFFTDVVGSNIQSTLSRTSACLKSARRDTPIKEVVSCIIE